MTYRIAVGPETYAGDVPADELVVALDDGREVRYVREGVDD